MTDSLPPVERPLRLAVGDELDPDHQATPAHVAHVRQRCDSTQAPREEPRRVLHARHEAVSLEEIEARERDRAAELIAGERVAVEERLQLGEVAVERVVDRVAHERRRDGQVAAGQSFAEGHEIGLDTLVLAREQLAGAAEAGRNFVREQQHVVLAAQTLDLAEEAGRHRPHPGRGLDERLDDETRDPP